MVIYLGHNWHIREFLAFFSQEKVIEEFSGAGAINFSPVKGTKFKLKTWKNEKRRTWRKLDFLRVFVQDLHVLICNLLAASTQRSK